MPGDAEFSPEHPVVRIRARMKERRVLEARFLLRQFSDEIDAEQRQTLEKEVSRLLAEVERLRHQARSAATEGRREEAGKLYRDIERLVADVPGLAEEQAALAGAEAVFARLSARSAAAPPPAPADGLDVDELPRESTRTAPKPEPLADAAAAPQELPQTVVAAETTVGRQSHRPSRFLGLWLAVIGCAGLAVLILLLIRQGGPKEPVTLQSLPPAPLPARGIVTKPAASPPPEIPAPVAAPAPVASPPLQPEPAPASSLLPTEPSAKQTVPPPVPAPQPTLRLGTLQVEKSKKIEKSKRK